MFALFGGWIADRRLGAQSAIPVGGALISAGNAPIFYLGISVGALLGSVLVPLAVSSFGWRFGFALPLFRMIFGLSQFLLTRRWLAPAPPLSSACSC